MRKISFNFLMLAVLTMAFGLASTAFAETKGIKIPKNMSVISVKTDQPMTVFVDGVELGKTEGSQIPFEKVVTPGFHDVKVVNDQGIGFVKSGVQFPKQARQCICLKTVSKTVETACPYNINVSGPDKVREGDLITFAAFNAVTGGATALNYLWNVAPGNARITSGLGTPSITIDSTGLGGETIRAEVDVTDGVYDAQCRQRIAVGTIVEKEVIPPPVMSYIFDKWEAKTFDDDKARLDNYATELFNKPDSQGYIIMYQGTGKRAQTVEKLSKRTLNYLVQRGVQPNKLQITNAGTDTNTRYEVWIVPPGANPPVPR